MTENNSKAQMAAGKGGRQAVNLALQGGGAHGAFTWGVLDRLLEDAPFDIGWISGTSAGAVNAAALAVGLARGGRDDARGTLKRIWDGVPSAGVPALLRLNPFFAAQMAGIGAAHAQISSVFSPYELNPLGVDPLRDLLNATLDFELLNTTSGPELLLAATDIATGLPRLFRRKETTLDVILASACLPTVHHAVAINGRAYWDGGFSANPDLVTLASESPAADTLIIQLNPLVKDGLPTTAREIAGHVNHLTFNRPYVMELEEIAQIRRHCSQLRGRMWLPRALGGPREKERRDARIARHRFHIVEAGRFTAGLPADSKSKPEQALIAYLFEAGRSEGAKWLDRTAAAIGRQDTADIERRLADAQSQRTVPDKVVSDAA